MAELLPRCRRNESWARRPATRSGGPWRRFGAEHPDVVVVDADVGNSTRTEWFGKKYPDRFFNIGIAESNLVGVAAGLASSGKTSVIASFAAFITCNAYDQLRMSVAYPRLNVKVVGSHAGHLDRRGRRLADGHRGRRPGLRAARLRGDRAGRRGVGQGRDRGDARVQGPGLSARRAPRRAQDLHRAARSRSRSARPTSCATAPT